MAGKQDFGLCSKHDTRYRISFDRQLFLAGRQAPKLYSRVATGRESLAILGNREAVHLAAMVHAPDLLAGFEIENLRRSVEAPCDQPLSVTVSSKARHKSGVRFEMSPLDFAVDVPNLPAPIAR